MADQGLLKEEARLRRAGHRLTRQRRIVLDVMRNSDGHITASDVVEQIAALEEGAPPVSLASVYRVLSWLVDHDVISVTDVGERDLVYEYLGHGRHHHLICRDCGATTSIPDDFFSGVIDDLYSRYGFEARMEHQAVFGTCRACGDDDT